jgi:hypothetical protein
MNLLPAYFGSRKRAEDVAPPPAEPEGDSRRDVFNLIPPRAETIEPAEQSAPPPEPEPQPEPPPPPAPDIGREVRPIGTTDLTRLSIDNDGRLYWDGKPVEVRRRLMLSRAQVVGLSLIALFIVISAVGAAIQGSVAAHEWACRLGWVTTYCAAPAAPPAPAPPPRPDIPA